MNAADAKRLLPPVLRKHAAQIESVSDERKSGFGGYTNDGYWVYLTPGFRWEDGHAIHESDPAECAARFPVDPCGCDECTNDDP